MHMILHAAYDDWLAIVIGEDAAKIAVQFVAQEFVAEKGPPVLGGKDHMHQNLAEGLGHELMMMDCGL